MRRLQSLRTAAKLFAGLLAGSQFAAGPEPARVVTAGQPGYDARVKVTCRDTAIAKGPRKWKT